MRRLRRRGRGGLVDAAELGTVWCEYGLPTLGDEECAGAVGGDDAKTAERVGDEPDKAAGAASGMHALRGSGDVGLEVGERAELRGDDASERVRALGVERLVGQRGLVALGGGRRGFLKEVMSCFCIIFFWWVIRHVRGGGGRNCC